MIPDLQSDAGVRAAALLVGLVLSAIFAALGYLVAYRQRYSLIASPAAEDRRGLLTSSSQWGDPHHWLSSKASSQVLAPIADSLK